MFLLTYLFTVVRTVNRLLGENGVVSSEKISRRTFPEIYFNLSGNFQKYVKGFFTLN